MPRSLLAVLLAFALPAFAADIVVKNAWAKEAKPGMPVSGAYFDLTAGHDAKLLAISTPAAGMVELHEMKMEGGMMKMRAVEALALPAGKTVSLKPGGLHVMLMQLSKPLMPGSKLPLTLTVEQNGKRETLTVEAEVKPLPVQ